MFLHFLRVKVSLPLQMKGHKPLQFDNSHFTYYTSSNGHLETQSVLDFQSTSFKESYILLAVLHEWIEA